MSGEAHPLTPKSGDTLRVIALGRISTVHQDVENIAASYRYIQSYLAKIYHGPLDIKFLGEQASGMRTDRATICEAEETIARGAVDLVIAEDLSRLYRNPRHQFRFVQDAVDAGTRVILIGDNLDTADENWEVMMGAAALRHGLHIPDTRRRVRRTATHSFHKGGMVQKIRFGYRKLSTEEANSGAFGPPGLRIAKRSELTPILRNVVRQVLAGESYASITDHLNATGITPGPYVTRGRWSPRVLVELLSDPILAGMRTFRDTVCEPVFRTGRHRTTKSDRPETEYYPELAHLTTEEHKQLLTVIADRRLQSKPSHENLSARRGVPRSRSYWPGQSLVCGVCGNLFYFSGDFLRCSRATPRNGSSCWNRVQVRNTVIRAQIAGWLLSTADAMPDGLRHLAERLHEFTVVQTDHDRSTAQATAGRRELLHRQAQHLTTAIAAGGNLESLLDRLQAVEAELKTLSAAAPRRHASKRGAVPPAKNQDPAVLRRRIVTMMQESFPFADWLRCFIPEFVVEPVQGWDTPQIRPQGRFSARMEMLAAPETESATDTAPRAFTLLLFDPPEPVRVLSQCLAALREHPERSQRRLAQQLQLHPMTVKRALDYARRMTIAGATEPYRLVTDAPAGASRWGRRSTTSTPTPQR